MSKVRKLSDTEELEQRYKIKCPQDLNQFLLGEPIFENPFSEEECKQRKFYGDCYHCFSTAIASRDHQLKNTINKVNKLQSDIWTDNLSFEYMAKIVESVEPHESEKSNEQTQSKEAQETT